MSGDGPASRTAGRSSNRSSTSSRTRWDARGAPDGRGLPGAAPDALREDAEAVVDLIYQEFVIRRWLGESPEPGGIPPPVPRLVRRAHPPVRGRRGHAVGRPERPSARTTCRGDDDRGPGSAPAGRALGAAAAVDRRLRDHRRAGPGRHGDRLQGARPAAQPDRGDQDDRRVRLRLAGAAPAVPGRGRGHRPAPASAHHPDPCHRRAGGPAVLLARVRRGREPGPAAGRGPDRRPSGRRAGRGAGAGRPRRPPGRDHPPRPQAQQRPARRPTARPRSAISAWPSCWATTRPGRSPARCWARPATWLPSRPRAVRATSGRPPTSTRWGRSSTRH